MVVVDKSKNHNSCTTEGLPKNEEETLRLHRSDVFNGRFSPN